MGEKNHDNLANHGGVYVILNVLECKVYVGQAKKFNNRSHLVELGQGMDNKNLQMDYNAGKEFVYFVVVDSEKNPNGETLGCYEKLYMTLFEDLGFCLYNTNIKREDRTVEKINIEDGEYRRAQEALTEDFKNRFKLGPKELVKAGLNDRNNALQYYLELRMERSLEKSDIFLFNRNRICNILGSEEKSIVPLDLNEMFWSKAGNYIGEGIDQILYYEMEAINNYGYCLWTIANNAVSVETVRKLCRNRKEEGKDTYVIFSYTPSSVYAAENAYRCSQLNKKCIKNLTPEELDFLNFTHCDNGKYIAPDKIDCTAASSSSAAAFIIEQIFPIKELIDESELKKQYSAVNKNGDIYNFETNFNRSTFFLRLDDNKAQAEKIYKELKECHSFVFVGKLAAPYVVRLERDEMY